MKNTKWIIAHFSPTGGTRRIADAIRSGLNSNVLELDLTGAIIPPELHANDGLLAVLPVYAGRVPQIALERLAAIRGYGQRAVAVVVYGNREYDDALLETKNALEANGFQVVAAAAFIAEHSIARSIAHGRPDAEDVKIAQRFAADILGKENTIVSVPGNFPYREIKPSAAHPAAGEGCAKCGICAAQCPTEAIDKEDPSRIRQDKCINCMHCVQVCPEQCRALPEDFQTMITRMLREKASAYKTPSIFL